MCIGLVQEKIRQFILSVKREIYRLYKKALLTGADMSDADVKQLIKGMKGGRFLSLLMSRRTLTNLQLELDMLTKRTSKEVQTSPETNMNSATSQTPKAINKITEKNVVHMATQTTKYFRVNADWHKETEDLDQIMF